MLRNRQVFEDGFRPSPADAAAAAGDEDDGDDACGPFLLSLLSTEGKGESTGGRVSAAIAQGAGRAAQAALTGPPKTVEMVTSALPVASLYGKQQF